MAVERKNYEEISKQLRSDPVAVLKAAGSSRMSLSQYVNSVAPEVFLEQKRSVLDRMVEEIGLFTRSSEISKSSTMDDFLERGPLGEALLYDILFRAYNGSRRTARDGTRVGSLISGHESYFDSDLYPATVSMPRPDKIVQSWIDIDELVAVDHEIRGSAYKPFRWKYDEASLQRRRTNPGTALPKRTLEHKEENVNLYKWGGAYELTYEALREHDTSIDKLSSLMELEGETEKIRMVGELLDILEDGDGTTGSAAASTKASEYDSAISASGIITVESYLGFIDSFIPYGLTHMIMRSDIRRKLILLTTGSDNVHLAQLIHINAIGVPGMTDMNGSMPVRFGAVRDEDLDANKIIGLNSMRAVEKVRSAGSSVQEQATNIMNQTETVTLSDTYNWAKLDFEATKILTLTV